MFQFQIIPEAEASVVTLMKSINKVIINPLILFLFACAMVYFLYGVSQFLLSPDNEEVRKKSKSVMIWGVAGLFIMVAVFGIERILLNTLSVSDIKIQDNGNYEITTTDGSSTSTYTVAGTKDNTKNTIKSVSLTSKKIDASGNPIDLTLKNYRGVWDASKNDPQLSSGAGTIGYYYVVSVDGATNLDGISSWSSGDWVLFDLDAKTNTKHWTRVTEGDTSSIDSNWQHGSGAVANSFTKSPFKALIENPKLCWHKDIPAKDVTEYKALKSIQGLARAIMRQDTNLTDAQIGVQYPKSFQSKTLYDATNKFYYVWWDARAPINGGTLSDCNLLQVPDPITLPDFKNQSTKRSSLIGKYVSDANYYRAVESGVDPILEVARNTAIFNAKIQIAKLMGLQDISKVPVPVVIDEKYFPRDPDTSNYDFWIALEVKK